jgi:hypothetical protein
MQTRGLAFLAAVCAAAGLHVLANDALRLPRDSIVIESLSSAGVLAVVCLVVTFAGRGSK